MRKTYVIVFFMALNFVLISAIPTEALVPIYALTSTDDYIAENDYELIYSNIEQPNIYRSL